MVRWKAYQTAPPTQEEAERWIQKFGSEIAIALVTGDVNGWVVIDADSAEAAEWVTQNFPHTPLRQKTRRGVHFFYRQGTRTVITKSGLGPNGKIDTRGRGGLAIIAPSVVDGFAREFELDDDFDVDDTKFILEDCSNRFSPGLKSAYW